MCLTYGCASQLATLSGKLRAQAAANRPEALATAQRATQAQAHMRAVTRRLMATISELSMYQATAMKHKAEYEAAEQEVAAARRALADGQPPTASAEKEWQAQVLLPGASA